jgi:VCBS repeat-containing protein
VNDTGTAVEAGGVANGTAGSAATGNVLTNDTDVDAGATRTVTAVRLGAIEGSGTAGTVGSAFVGQYGTLTLGSAGAYSYVVNNGLAAVQALRPGQSLTESFNYTVSDGALTDTAMLTVTINGANDAPVGVNDVAAGMANGVLTLAATTLLANDTDVDAGDTRTLASVAAVSTLGASVSVDGAGTVVYDPRNAATLRALAAGQTATDSVTYTLRDAAGATATATVAIVVTGVNDAPVGVNDTGTAIEAGGVANGTAGSAAAGNVLTNDTDPDAGATRTVTAVRLGAIEGSGTAGTVGSAVVGQYGTLTLGAAGAYSYVVNDTRSPTGR